MKKIVILLLVVISLLAISCNEKEAVSEDGKTNEEKQQQQKESVQTAKPEIKGEVIEQNEITNEEGGFIIPIPDSWFGKTSYENIGKETIIYHITNDPAEMSENPILLHVAAVYDGEDFEDDLASEIFLELDGVSFYDVPVFDFPYEVDSQDGKEYSSFMDDKMLVLQSFWTTDDSIGFEMDYTTLLTQSNWIATNLYTGSEWQEAEYWWISFNRDNTFDSVFNEFSEVGVWSLDGATLTLEHEFDAEIFIIDIIEQQDGYTLTLDGYAGEGSTLELDSTDFEADLVSDVSPEDKSMHEFTSSDASLNGLMLGCIKSEVLDNISCNYSIESEEQVEYGATGDIIDVYHYSFGSISFNGDMFAEAVVNKPGISGPRGFEVGDDISDIVDSFAGFDALQIDSTTIFYRLNSDDIDSLNHVPPYFIMDEESKFLALSCFEDDSILSELSMQEIKDIYYFEITNNCNFYYDDNGKVTSFILNQGAMSE